MVVPLINEQLKISVDSGYIHVMQCPEMHFTRAVNFTLTLQKHEQGVVSISDASPNITPQSLDPLIVRAPSSQSTSSVCAPENVHKKTDCVVLTSIITANSRGQSVFSNGIYKTIKNSVAPIIVRSLQENNKSAVTINSTVYDNSPP